MGAPSSTTGTSQGKRAPHLASFRKHTLRQLHIICTSFGSRFRKTHFASTRLNCKRCEPHRSLVLPGFSVQFA
ncbi:hypothetical protein KC19_5G193400 [Ceratodon purpureus]|uniref:Uncharacterized protein n=1 Tax=Ceratodon purpureus TaxID=3225 RepID=A0A8T0I6A9_CERPU|nr:hypothetical protein KC19_5G193400 [Ceratodon purpureus]